jgi:hypothetical protein
VSKKQGTRESKSASVKGSVRERESAKTKKSSDIVTIPKEMYKTHVEKTLVSAVKKK